MKYVYPLSTYTVSVSGASGLVAISVHGRLVRGNQIPDLLAGPFSVTFWLLWRWFIVNIIQEIKLTLEMFWITIMILRYLFRFNVSSNLMVIIGVICVHCKCSCKVVFGGAHTLRYLDNESFTLNRWWRSECNNKSFTLNRWWRSEYNNENFTLNRWWRSECQYTTAHDDVLLSTGAKL